MHFDRGNADRGDRVANRIGIVRVRAGIDRDRIVPAARRMQFVDDRALGIVLDGGHADTERGGFASDAFVDVGEGAIAVRLRLARAQQIEIRAVDHEHVHVPGVREGNEPALGNDVAMPDRILTATAVDGSFSVVAGITTELVRETQRRNDLAPTASAAVGRLLTASALLGASLKGKEKLSLQVVGDGPLKRMIADVQLNAPSEIGARAYTSQPGVDVPLNALGKFDVGGAVGRGRLQVTRSFEVGQPYVGIVELQSGEIGDDIAAYLMNSEQIPSVVALGVLANPGGIKASGGIIAQVLPGASESTIATLETRAGEMPAVTTQIDAGAPVEALIASIAGPLATRLTRTYDVAFTCTCSRDRVERALLGLGRAELQKLLREQNKAEAICEFCKTAYVLTPDEVHGLIDRLEAHR